MSGIDRLLKTLESLRTDYIDEIPEEHVHGELRYKTQKNWFHIFGLTMLYAIDQHLIKDPEIIRDYNTLAEQLETRLDTGYTSRRDIDETNAFLDRVVAYYKQR